MQGVTPALNRILREADIPRQAVSSFQAFCPFHVRDALGVAAKTVALAEETAQLATTSR